MGTGLHPGPRAPSTPRGTWAGDGVAGRGCTRSPCWNLPRGLWRRPGRATLGTAHCPLGGLTRWQEAACDRPRPSTLTPPQAPAGCALVVTRVDGDRRLPWPHPVAGDVLPRDGTQDGAAARDSTPEARRALPGTWTLQKRGSPLPPRAATPSCSPDGPQKPLHTPLPHRHPPCASPGEMALHALPAHVQGLKQQVPISRPVLGRAP